MTDRELLELAAKAVGYKLEFEPDDSPFPGAAFTYDADPDGCLTIWNPLTDDGDALRLAGTLKLSVTQIPAEDGDGPCIFVSDEKSRDLDWEEVEEESERQSAIRRAIVRAAAEIGKGMR